MPESVDPELDRTCASCQAAHPSEPFESDFAICLNAPELEPYLDDILERQDFSRCRELVERIRFPWDQEACEDFDPLEDMGPELSQELADRVKALSEKGELTPEALKHILYIHAFEHTDWPSASVDDYVRRLEEAETLEARTRAISVFRFLLSQDNSAAFDALCSYLRALPPAKSVEDKSLRIALLETLAGNRERKRELAHLLVEDLMRTPSTPATRGWYAAVFRFLEGVWPPDIAVEALEPVASSRHFSPRMKRRIREILESAEWDRLHP